MKFTVKCPPPLDPEFQPASLWIRSYEEACLKESDTRRVQFTVSRPDGTKWSYSTRLLPEKLAFSALNLRFSERLVKSLLWMWGGNLVHIHNAPDVVEWLQKEYSSNGKRSFDAGFMGQRCFDEPFSVIAINERIADEPQMLETRQSGNLNGCRVGFDLGGSDRKCAAVMDGEVIFSEEVKWDPYFQSDPDYHRKGILDTIRRAAEKLPRVDAIGGSAAGIYINNEPRVGSLFRGVSDADFQTHIRPLFKEIRKTYGNIPLEVANDGDVTALAGSISTGHTGILGISMGTSQAAGYIDPTGNLAGWLNELAFVPVDFRKQAPVDEWSDDTGCGVQYFSQQAVGRLAARAGFENTGKIPLPDLLEQLQSVITKGDDRAIGIFETIGTYFGYALAWYANFYSVRKVLTLGRVTTGDGGELITLAARNVLQTEFPELAEQVDFLSTDETMKRHGQAVAAASLTELK